MEDTTLLTTDTTTSTDSATTDTSTTQQTQTQTAQSGFVNPDGTFSDGWLEKLPPELADARATLGKYKNVAELGKAYHHLSQNLGKKANAIVPLTDKSTPEEVAAYRKAMGVPEKPEDYKLKPDQMPEGMEWSPEVEKNFAAIAHKHNLPLSAMRELSAAYVAMDNQKSEAAMQMAVEQLRQAESSLKDEWKGNFGKNLETASRVAKLVGLDPKSPGLRDPAVVKALHQMSQFIAEDKLVTGNLNASNTPGRDRAMMIMKGAAATSDPELLRLHRLYQDGDKETSEMVTNLLKNG